METLTPFRHVADRGAIQGRLVEVAEAAVDFVAPASALKFVTDDFTAVRDHPELHLTEPHVAHDGVWDALPVDLTRTAFRQLAERCDIPLKYADLLSGQQPMLMAENFDERTGFLNQRTLFRLIRTGERWTLRAVLSDSFRAIDNVEVLTAVIRGMNRSGVASLADCEVEGDWSMDRFRLRIAIPEINVAAHDLLADYRSPFNGGTPSPMIWAGLEVSNSETGNGSVSLTPRAVILVCRNGLTRATDLVRSVHLGSRLEDGPVVWSVETQRKAVELIEAKVADAVTQFCSVEYLEGLVNEMRAAKDVQVADVTKAFEVTQARLGFSEDEVREALNCFTRSGDTSVLGLGNAFTAAAQLVEDSDRQTEMERSFWEIVAQPAQFAGVTP